MNSILYIHLQSLAQQFFSEHMRILFPIFQSALFEASFKELTDMLLLHFHFLLKLAVAHPLSPYSLFQVEAVRDVKRLAYNCFLLFDLELTPSLPLLKPTRLRLHIH